MTTVKIVSSFEHHITIAFEGRLVQIAKPHHGCVNDGVVHVFPKKESVAAGAPEYVKVGDDIVEQIRKHPNF